jgi:hypothetical protein
MSGGIPSWAVKGAKVVCIERNWFAAGPSDIDAPDPVFGEIYTIRGIIADADYESGWGAWLTEFSECGCYDLIGFRPVHTLETDISEHFAQFLKTPSRQRELAE